MKSDIDTFRDKYLMFIQELEAIAKERNKKRDWDSQFEMKYWKFIKTIVDPMELAWSKVALAQKEEQIENIYPHLKDVKLKEVK